MGLIFLMASAALLALQLLPLIVATVHSVVGMHIINDYLVAFGQPSSMSNALITGAVLILIYGGYFIATYSGYKGIIEE